MLRYFAGPIEIPDNPQTRMLGLVIAGVFIISYICVTFIASIVMAQIIKLIIKRVSPGSSFASRLAYPKGTTVYSYYLFAVSLVSTTLLIVFAWPYFDEINSDAVGNILFLLTIVAVATIVASSLYNLTYKKVPSKSKK